jgi:hypothetical protein
VKAAGDKTSNAAPDQTGKNGKGASDPDEGRAT